MKKWTTAIGMILAGALLFPARGLPTPRQAGERPSPAVRPIGVVTKIASGQLTLHTDAGPSLTVHLPQGVSVLEVPPGAKSLKSAAKITLNEISVGDRVLVLGPVSPDQKSVLAKSVIVMSKTALARAREQEQLEWERRGISGVVESIDPANEQIVLSVPNTPPTPQNPTHPVTLTFKPHAVLLRYAPDSVKFSDAKRAPFEAIKVGDQVQALGDKSPDGRHFAVEKLVSGTFRNIGAKVISVNAARHTIMVKDLATGKPLLVRTDADSRMHQLPPRLAQMIAMFNSGGAPGKGTPRHPPNGQRPGDAGAHGRGMNSGEPPHMTHNLQEMLEKTPPLTFKELKRGEPLIVVSTAGSKPSEVTAIAVLSGVEPILAARPKGSKSVALGPWNMSVGGGGGGNGMEGP